MTRNEDRVSFDVLTGGWIRWKQSAMAVYVRFRLDPTGERLRPAKVYVEVDKEHALDVAMWRSVPIARLETAINNPRVLRWLVPLLDTNDDVDLPNALGFTEIGPPKTFSSTRRSLRLPKPIGHRYPDSFYEHVAEAYRYCVEHSEPPANTIAEINHLPVTTVHRWFAEARRRKLLGPAQSMGRVG